jgi:enoyl-CoA hydratase/carnithine racemase
LPQAPISVRCSAAPYGLISISARAANWRADWRRPPFLTIAAINGFALGGGFELALACHLRIVSDSAILGLPETKLGILPANGGTARLTRLIAPAAPLKLIVLGERVDATEAEATGYRQLDTPERHI